MKRIKLKLTNIASQIENEDFFSLRVTYNSSSESKLQRIGGKTKPMQKLTLSATNLSSISSNGI